MTEEGITRKNGLEITVEMDTGEILSIVRKPICVYAANGSSAAWYRRFRPRAEITEETGWNFPLCHQNPDGLNLILGMAHFIKTVEDVHEAMVNAAGSQVRTGFCEPPMSV